MNMDTKRMKFTRNGFEQKAGESAERMHRKHMEHMEHMEYRDRKRPAHSLGGHRGTQMTQRARAQTGRQVDTHA